MEMKPDPRIPCIETLKAQGYTTDYSLEYKMTDEKRAIAEAKRKRKKRAELWQGKTKAKETQPQELIAALEKTISSYRRKKAMFYKAAIHADLETAKAEVITLADLLNHIPVSGAMEKQTPAGLSRLAGHIAQDIDNILQEI
jgi:hypothetical protein